MKVLLVDDHVLFLDGLRNLLTSRGIDVVGTARDGLEALECVRTLHPDVVLMDINMPRVGGLAALRLIKAEFPDTKVVMLTMAVDDEPLFEAVRSGASGYLLKALETETFFELLENVQRGEVALSPGLVSRILQEFRTSAAAHGSGEQTGADLSPRELQVLTLVAQGLTYKEVAAKLFLTERTIKYHMSEIVGRLQVKNRAEAITRARRMGMV